MTDVLAVDLLPEGLGTATLVLVLLAGLTAGFIDAVVGGGGLVQLPALLLVPGISPVEALATNKLGSVFGTTTSAVTYYRRVHPDLRTALPMAAVALVGSFAGASVASLLPASVFKPVIVVALVGIGGVHAAAAGAGRRHRAAAQPAAGTTGRRRSIGAAIGFYDGILGPGTGSFLVFAMVSLLGYAFLDASAKAKIVNCATNLGALLFFVPNGYVYWGLGLLLGAANMLGGYLGARTATARGSRFIRVAFLVVVARWCCGSAGTSGRRTSAPHGCSRRGQRDLLAAADRVRGCAVPVSGTLHRRTLSTRRAAVSPGGSARAVRPAGRRAPDPRPGRRSAARRGADHRDGGRGPRRTGRRGRCTGGRW